jgi:hypothetical protein
MTERTIFQPPFSLKIEVGERVSEFQKKISMMSLVKQYEDFNETS